MFLKLFSISLSVFLFSACKMVQPKKAMLRGGFGVSRPSVSGTLDSQNRVRLAIPDDISGPPTARSSTARIPSSFGRIPRSLGLARGNWNLPSTDIEGSGGELIRADCFGDTEFDKLKGVGRRGWHFAAVLMHESAETGISYTDVPLDGCGGDVQLQLLRLRKDEGVSYRIKAYIYHMSKRAGANPNVNSWFDIQEYGDNPQNYEIIVYYEGGSGAQGEGVFTAGSSTEVRLTRVILDQKVDVIVEKTEEEKCIARKKFWSDNKCLSNSVRLAPVYAAEPGAEDDEEETKYKCLDFADFSLAPCGGRGQTVSLKYLGKDEQILKNSGVEKEVRWFQIEIGTDCLAIAADGSSLTRESCIQDSSKQSDYGRLGEQLWAFEPARPSDRGVSRKHAGYRGTYRVVQHGSYISTSMEKRCLFVAPKSSAVGETDTDMTKIVLGECDDLGKNEIHESQWVKIITDEED